MILSKCVVERRAKMGTYLSCGIATSIVIRKRVGSLWNIQEKKDDILKEMGNYINTNLYKTELFDDGIVLNLKENIVNRDLLSFMKEANELINFQSDLSFYADKKIDFDNHTFAIKMNNDDYYLEIDNKEKIEEFVGRNNSSPWIIYNDDSMIHNLLIQYNMIIFWMDSAKFVGEDPLTYLYIFNKMKNKYYKNKLKGCFIYHIY